MERSVIETLVVPEHLARIASLGMREFPVVVIEVADQVLDKAPDEDRIAVMSGVRDCLLERLQNEDIRKAEEVRSKQLLNMTHGLRKLRDPRSTPRHQRVLFE